ncbi:MAG: hypothetical protein SVU32_05950 [Candidatus Nanohaloarchaea archaeon]|nr:hypothetical protein [Candidatus Nanohaloarchaea archaeon]
MSSNDRRVRNRIEDEIETYSRFLSGSNPAFQEYLEDEMEAILGDEEHGNYIDDHVADAAHDAVAHFLDEQPDQAAELFQNVRSEAVWSEDIPSTYKEDILQGVAHAAADYLQEQGYEVDEPRDVALRFSPSTGSYDWENDVVRIGEQEPEIAYKPGMFGLMVHELFHKKQFHDKVEAGVDRYNQLVRNNEVGLEPVGKSSNDYHSHGIMMQARGDMIATIIKQASDDGTEEAEEHLEKAIAEEIDAYRYAPSDPYETDRGGRHTSLFSPDDEVMPHLLYLEAENITDEDEIEQYLEEVVQNNTGGDQIEQAMREQL